MNDFWEWLPKAYRDGDVGDEPKFTKYNMETAFLAGGSVQRAPVGVECDCPYLNIHDAVIRENARLTELLHRAETEMRYAGWDKYESDNSARNGVYEQIVKFLNPVVEKENT
jgi:hypothetical protein